MAEAVERSEEQVEAVEFRANGGRAWLATFGLLSSAVTQLLFSSFIGFSMVAFPDWEARVEAGDLRALAFAAGYTWAAFLSLGTLGLSGIAFLAWLYRAHQNANALGSYLRATPFSAVICWFIPVVGLFRPYSIVKALYLSSTRGQASKNDLLERMPSLWGLWWTTWLSSAILDNLSWRLDKSDGPSNGTLWLDLVSTPLKLVAAACATIIVRTIQRAQEKRANASAEDMPHFVPGNGDNA